MVLSKEEKIKLLEKARAVKAEKAKLKLANKNQIEAQSEAQAQPEPKKAIPQVNDEMISVKKELVEHKTKSKTNKNKERKVLELNTIDDVREAEKDFEVKEEVIRIKAPSKKKIVKRVIEMEESDTEEEIIEEIVKIPKTRTINKRNENKNQPDKQQQRLMTELFGV